jgi:hypothetical protein
VNSTTVSAVQPHNERPAAVWSSGGKHYEEISRGINTFRLGFERATSYYREPSAEAAWLTFSTGYGPTRTLAMSLDPNRRDALRDDFIAFHTTFATELGICVPREYLLTVGVR